jgi:hypothetical protein
MKWRMISKSIRMNTIGDGLEEIERFKKTSKTFFIKNKSKFINYPLFFSSISDKIISKLKYSCIQTSIKFNIHVDSVYERTLSNETQSVVFKTKNKLGCNSSNFMSLLDSMFRKILEEESEYMF